MMTFDRLIVFVCLISLVGCSESDNTAADPDALDAGRRDVTAQADVEPDGTSSSADTSSDTAADAAMGPAAMRVSPAQLFFSNVQIGQTETASFSVSNVGESTLYITDVTLVERTDDDHRELVEGDRWLEGDNVAVEAGTFTSFDVDYAPADQAVDRGFVKISATDPAVAEVVVPIDTVNAYPDIDAPKTIRFGSVSVGQTATEQVVVHNRGISPLTIDDIVLTNGSPAFSRTIEPPYEPPVVLDRGDYVSFELSYAPFDAETDQSSLLIESNDPDQPDYEIGVAGNLPTPCIAASADSLDFGDISAGQSSTKSVTIVNCSETRQLDISQVALSTDGGGAFELAAAPQTPSTLAPTTTAEIEVRARADQPRQATGVLAISSDDPRQSGLVVNLRAEFVAQ